MKVIWNSLPVCLIPWWSQLIVCDCLIRFFASAPNLLCIRFGLCVSALENLLNVRIRSVGTSSEQTISMVEVFHESCWNALCAPTWRDSEARAVCRQLGYTAGMTSSSSPSNLPTDVDIVGGTVRCNGDEDNLAFCVIFLRRRDTCGQPSLVQCSGLASFLLSLQTCLAPAPASAVLCFWNS